MPWRVRLFQGGGQAVETSGVTFAKRIFAPCDEPLGSEARPDLGGNQGLALEGAMAVAVAAVLALAPPVSLQG